MAETLNALGAWMDITDQQLKNMLELIECQDEVIKSLNRRVHLQGEMIRCLAKLEGCNVDKKEGNKD